MYHINLYVLLTYCYAWCHQRGCGAACAPAPHWLTSRSRITFKNYCSCISERPWLVHLLQPVLRTNALLGTSSPQPVLFRTNNLQRRPESVVSLLFWTGPNEVCPTQIICKETAQARVATMLTPTFEMRGDPVKGGKAKTCSTRQGENTLYSVFTKNKELFN